MPPKWLRPRPNGSPAPSMRRRPSSPSTQSWPRPIRPGKPLSGPGPRGRSARKPRRPPSLPAARPRRTARGKQGSASPRSLSFGSGSACPSLARVAAVADAVILLQPLAHYDWRASIDARTVALNGLGRAAYLAGQIEIARKSLQDAIDLTPEFAEAHLTLGMLYETYRERANADRWLELAVLYFRNALALDQENPEANLQLGKLLAFHGVIAYDRQKYLPEAIKGLKAYGRLARIGPRASPGSSGGSATATTAALDVMYAAAPCSTASPTGPTSSPSSSNSPRN